MQVMSECLRNYSRQNEQMSHVHFAAKKLPKNDTTGPSQSRPRGVDLNQETQPETTGCCK